MSRFSSQLRERCEDTERRAVTMLIFLLMPFLVRAEWVEISQNHYRKEPHRSVIHLSDSTTSKYKNDSITEYQWSKGYVDRVPSVANVQQRIHKVERRPSVKIERTPFHRDDSVIMDTPEHRWTNEMKSSNPVQTFGRHEDRNKVSHKQGTQHPTVKGEYRINDRNMPKIKTVLNEKIKGNNIEREESSDKYTSTSTLGKAGLRIKGFSEIPAEDFTEKKTMDFQEVTTEKYLQNKNEEMFNSRHKPRDDEKLNKTKNNGIDTLIKFLKVVSQTIQRNARRSFNGKVRYLEDLKDTLLANIEARIESEFPDDSVKRRRRRSESYGHVDFPSSESALMTISFLTFAVFLIKLVLQVIHTYKAKTMMVTPAVVATVGRSGVFKKPLNK